LAETIISTTSLTKYYGKVLGVRDLDLEVAPGEVFGFLGPNGAGKTTTIRLLMGLLRPSAGSGSILGMDTWSQTVAVKARVGYLPGDARLYRGMKGEEHIRYIASLNGTGEKTGLELASRLELDITRRAAGYSRGMGQKLAIILALMKSPPVIIMDEPTNGLDPLTQRELYEILNERRNEGATILFSSHNLPEVERICDRVGIIRSGGLVATERMEDLRAMRLRNVEIIFEGALPADLDLESLPGVTGVERMGTRVQMKLRGDINPLLRLAARYDVADFSVSHASLEDVFIEFYEQPGGDDGGGAGAGGGEGAEGGRPA
jgi:ABC-2 type transport system ATP-binding protein